MGQSTSPSCLRFGLDIPSLVGAWGGAGGGVREGGVAYTFPVCQGEGEIAFDLSLVCEDARLDSP